MKKFSGPSIGFVSTYPPTVCGIATYTASLVNALAGQRGTRRRVGVVSLTDRNVGVAGPPVVFHHRGGDISSLKAATRMLNTYDTVSVQHEFGIFAGPDGDEVVELISGLTVPTAVTLHTVLNEPTDHQESIVRQICDMAQRVIVMSRTASDRLVSRYGVDRHLISMIPHGADSEFAGAPQSTGNRPLLLTWGLIGPGKGLEWAIEACAGLAGMDPLPRYVILGSTHPQVRHQSGESYRQSLMSLADRLGVGNMVEFDNRYLDRKTLARQVKSADVVVLPYESVEQVTSGVLVEAIAAGKPVVATPFPHAVELLSEGAGVVVPYGDPTAMSNALRGLLSEPDSLATMSKRAREMADGWYWPTVGIQFADVMSEIAQRDVVEMSLTASG